MTDQDGLPLPPQHPVSAPRAPDLDPDLVRMSLDSTAGDAGETTSPWASALKGASGQAGPPSVVAFVSGGNGLLGPVQSKFERAVGGDESPAGMAAGLGRGALTGLSSPVASAVDEAMTSRIRAAQQAFLQKHSDNLWNLSAELARAKRAMRELADLLDRTSFDLSRLDQIMQAKHRLGTDELLQTEDALNAATDPKERERLQTMKDDMTKWITERDRRLAAEQPAADLLHAREGQLNRQILTQRNAMYAAVDSADPTTETSNGIVTATTHDQPGAVNHVASLRNFLLQSHIGN